MKPEVLVVKAKAPSRSKQMPREERRESVLAAARKVFMEQGYGGASMRTIAIAAGVNEAMLYRIAPSKKELFEEAVAGPLEEAVTYTAEQSMLRALQHPGTKDMRELTRRYIEDLLKAMREIAPLMSAVLLTDQDTGRKFQSERLEPSIRKMIGVVESNLTYWPHREFDVDFLIRAVFGICWYLAIDHRFRGEAVADSEYQASQIVQLIFDGLLLKGP